MLHNEWTCYRHPSFPHFAEEKDGKRQQSDINYPFADITAFN